MKDRFVFIQKRVITTISENRTDLFFSISVFYNIFSFDDYIFVAGIMFAMEHSKNRAID